MRGGFVVGGFVGGGFVMGGYVVHSKKLSGIQQNTSRWEECYAPAGLLVDYDVGDIGLNSYIIFAKGNILTALENNNGPAEFVFMSPIFLCVRRTSWTLSLGAFAPIASTVCTIDTSRLLNCE